MSTKASGDAASVDPRIEKLLSYYDGITSSRNFSREEKAGYLAACVNAPGVPSFGISGLTIRDLMDKILRGLPLGVPSGDHNA